MKTDELGFPIESITLHRTQSAKSRLIAINRNISLLKRVKARLKRVFIVIALNSLARELVEADIEIRLRRKKSRPIADADDTVLINRTEQAIRTFVELLIESGRLSNGKRRKTESYDIIA